MTPKKPKKRPQIQDMPELTADPFIVKQFTNHLIAAFEQFIRDYPGNVDYIDGFMAAHNFHKVVIGHLVEETETPLLWNMALATFQKTAEAEMNKPAAGDPS